jgi:uncharacterized protein YbaR (Trm112 family)
MERCIQRPAAGRRFPVPLDARLLELLCCPSCRGAVRPLPDDGGLECVSCRRIYPVLDGIPVMLVEESRLP